MGRKWLSRGQNHWQDIQTGLFRVWKGIWCKARNKNKNPRRKKKLTSLLVVKTRSLNTRDSCRRTNPPFNHQGPSSSLSVCVFVCVCGTGANILTSVKCTRYLTQALCVLFIKQNSCNWQGKSATPCRSLENVLFFCRRNTKWFPFLSVLENVLFTGACNLGICVHWFRHLRRIIGRIKQ